LKVVLGTRFSIGSNTQKDSREVYFGVFIPKTPFLGLMKFQKFWYYLQKIKINKSELRLGTQLDVFRYLVGFYFTISNISLIYFKDCRINRGNEV